MYYKVILRRVRVTTVDMKKEKKTHSEYMSVALAIQYSLRMHRIILSSVTCLALPYFSAYLINGTIFGEKSYGT